MAERKKPLPLLAGITIFLLLLGLALLLAWGWGRPEKTGTAAGRRMDLAAFDESEVHVAIFLEQSAEGRLFLAATFTPQIAGFHLYSKDLPREGLEGLGRPTLLELAPDSRMVAEGGLIESVSPSLSPAGGAGQELPVYPAGPVTLRLPVRLPPGPDPWVEEQVSITYMLCSGTKCKRPVVNKPVSLRVPAAGHEDW